LRDRAEERLAALVDDATARSEDMRSQADDLLARADERGKQLRSDFERESRPRRWPWQPKTLRDRADERLGDIESYIRDARASSGDAGAALQGALKAAPAAIGAAAASAVDGVRESADSTAPGIRDGVGDVGKRIGDTTDSAAASVRSAAHVPVDALNRKVESGKRTVRWTVRVGKFTFWALLIGAAIGILYSPRSGREMRQEIRFNINRFLDMILPVE
jgi:gas vesicle protein